MFRLDLLQNDQVRYANQPIAVVIAETLEAATEGASLLSPRYEKLHARVGLDASESFVPAAVGVGNPARVQRGDVEAALAAASHRIDATYETPTQYHNAMEPHAIVAAWDDGSLSIDTPSQGLAMARARIAGLFGIAPEKIHIRGPFLGGGFGSKGMISGPQVLGIMAARLVGRPVKLVLRREQMYGPVGHRAHHVPVNADVPSVEALMIEERDPHVNALGIKGVGEIGITGTAGAIANAVWHATGIRVRRFPIRIDDLVLPASD
jgi:xanthine dehydrogenase YagR molybdenum-binding subunit